MILSPHGGPCERRRMEMIFLISDGMAPAFRQGLLQAGSLRPFCGSNPFDFSLMYICSHNVNNITQSIPLCNKFYKICLFCAFPGIFLYLNREKYLPEPACPLFRPHPQENGAARTAKMLPSKKVSAHHSP